MFRRSILSIAVCIFAVHEIFGDQRQAKSSVFQINHKKPIHAVSDKFLSFTVDPTTLLHVADCELTNATLSMIRGLLPAYLRVAGTDSNRLLFKSLPDGKFSSDSLASTSPKSKNLVLSGNQWNKFYEFVSSTDLNLIVCLSGGIFNEQTDRDLSNALEFITFSNRNNFNLNWQLGYELQKISRDDGKATGQDVAKLRKILEVFPRYQNSLIVGPDVTNFDSKENILFLRNYLLQSQNSLNSFTIHPNFTTIPDKDLYDSLSDLFAKMDTYLWLRDGIFKTASKGVVPRKPIWIAESEDKESECKFSDSMSLIKRLGFAAKLGASVYLRKPHLLSIYEPTSEFWAASFFKALVGRSVLDTRLASGNNSSVVVFSHCTQILEKPEESIINPALAYERGSITAYGVNTEPEPVRLTFKTGIKMDETIHMYVLTEDSTNRIGKTLFNRRHFGLSNENDLPMVSPKIRESAESVVVPANSIFFLVFPNIRCRACMQQLIEDNQEAAKTKVRPSITDEDELMNSSESSANISENFDEPEDENAVYVSYPTKSERIKAAQVHSPEVTEVPEELKQLSLDTPVVGPKYFTFSEDTWFSSFPEKFKKIEELSDKVPLDSQSKKEKHLEFENYQVFAQAMVGQRNVTAKSSSLGEESGTERHLEDNNKDVNHRMKRRMRIPRSVASLPSEINSLYQQIRGSSRYAFVPYDLPISDDLEESNDKPSYWHARSRRDTVGDSLMQTDSPKEMIKIFEQLPDPKNTILPAEEDKLFGSNVDKMNPPSISPELVAESDGPVVIRQDREINSKSVAPLINSASDTRTVMEDSNVAASLGPVSPFSRHHMKPTKTKSKSSKVKKMGKSVDSYQSELNETSSSQLNSEMSLNKSTVQSVDTTEESAVNKAKPGSSEIPAETQTTSTLSLDSTYTTKTENPDNSAENERPAVSMARNADSPGDHEVSPKHATNEGIVSKSVPHLVHSATHKNKETAHPSHPTHHNGAAVHPAIRTRTKDLKAKASPSNPLDDFTKKLRDDVSKLQSPLDRNQVIELAHARIQELLNIHKARLEEKQRKIQEAAASRRREGKNSNQGRNKRETIDSASPMEPANSLDESESNDDVVASARLVHPQKGQAPTHHHGSTEASFRLAPHLHRNTEAPRTAPTHLHGSNEAHSRPAPTHLHRSTEAPRTTPTRPRGSTNAPFRSTPIHLHRSTEAPSRKAPTHLHGNTEGPSRTESVPKKEKPSKQQFQVPHKDKHDLRHTTTKSPLVDKHGARLHVHESKLDRHQLHRRDVLDDLISKVKHVYDDVSTEVQKNLAPAEKWVEEQAEDVKDKLTKLRTKRDLGALKDRFRERREKLRQNIEEIREHHRIHVRDVGSHHQPRPAHHFDEKIKDNEKWLHHAADLKKKMKQDHERSREHKIAEISKHKLVPSNFIEPGRKRFVRSASSNNSSDERDQQNNEVIFLEDSFSDKVNESSLNKSEPRIFGNFSDILSPPEKKSASTENQCNGTNFLSNMWCETVTLFSNLFSSI